MTALISIKDLSFTYPVGVKALSNINLEINQGEVVAIIGQNGSGKTTLVKHFNGLLIPTLGAVLIKGVSTIERTVAKLSRTVGYVFQNPDDQIFNSSVSSEVAFGPRNLGFKKAQLKRKVHDALETVGLLEVKNKHPLDLDLNQKKLVAIASVIAMNPELIILDEPTTGQDHAGLVYVESLIKRLKENHTIVLISHDMNLVARVATRVIIMCEGEIIFDGSPRDAFKRIDLLSKTYLKPPVITQLAQRIKGFRDDILTIDEFIDEIIKNKSRASKSRS